MIINVTKNHIKRGRARSNYSCPIALAIGEVFDPCEINVGLYRIEITRDEDRYFISEFVSNKVNNFIEDFDDGEEVKPFSFNLPITKQKIKELKS